MYFGFRGRNFIVASFPRLRPAPVPGDEMSLPLGYWREKKRLYFLSEDFSAQSICSALES
ncbi:unnamed protein product [Amoebophrya sp. A120]|nr:unnamed protein product [Amoebophrya sp. A120]|eukprot:GSA120T00013500001.1